MASTSGVSSSLGSASGLDLTGLLADLREAEEVKVTNAENKVTLQESKISAWDAVEEAVVTLDTAAEALQDEDLFNSVTATTTSTAFTATGTGDIATGDYSIGVSQLAQAESVYTNSTDITSKTQVISEDSTDTSIVFRFNENEETTLTLDGGEITLQSLADAINADSSLGVSATIINTGSSVRLALTSTETGTDAALTEIEVVNNAELSDLISYSASDTSNMTVGTSAQNAIMTVNGLEIESQSNTVDHAVEGLSFELNETTDTDAKLTVAQDTDAIVSAITEFVEAYNNLISTMDQATTFNVDEETQAALTGDSTIRSMENQYKTAIQGTGTGSVISNLSGMGITTITDDGETKGQLQIDTEKLNSSVENYSSDVQSVFQGENGVATNVTSYTDAQLETGGFFDTNTENMNDKLKDLEAQVEIVQERVDTTMNIYEDKFIALDASVASMNSTKEYLEQQFAVLESDD